MKNIKEHKLTLALVGVGVGVGLYFLIKNNTKSGSQNACMRGRRDDYEKYLARRAGRAGIVATGGSHLAAMGGSARQALVAQMYAQGPINTEGLLVPSAGPAAAGMRGCSTFVARPHERETRTQFMGTNLFRKNKRTAPRDVGNDDDIAPVDDAYEARARPLASPL